MNMDKDQKKGNCAENVKDEEFIQAINLPVFEVETNDDLPKLVDNNYVLNGKREKSISPPCQELIKKSPQKQ
eukprot:12702431-Ditylum_brightwellii.AAC.1